MPTETIEKPSQKETGMCAHGNFPSTCPACQRIPNEKNYASRLADALHPPQKKGGVSPQPLSLEELRAWQEKGIEIFNGSFDDIFGETFRREEFDRRIGQATTKEQLLALQQEGEKKFTKEVFEGRFKKKIADAIKNIKIRDVA